MYFKAQIKKFQEFKKKWKNYSVIKKIIKIEIKDKASISKNMKKIIMTK